MTGLPYGTTVIIDWPDAPHYHGRAATLGTAETRDGHTCRHIVFADNLEDAWIPEAHIHIAGGLCPGDRIYVDRPGETVQHGRFGYAHGACTVMGADAREVTLDPAGDAPRNFQIPVRYLRPVSRPMPDTDTPGGQP